MAHIYDLTQMVENIIEESGVYSSLVHAQVTMAEIMIYFNLLGPFTY